LLYPFMTTELEGGEGSVPRPGHSLPPGKTQYPLYRRLGGPQGWSGQVRKISPPTRIRSPDRPAHSQSLYQLRYPAHMKVYRMHLNIDAGKWHFHVPDYFIKRKDSRYPVVSTTAGLDALKK